MISVKDPEQDRSHLLGHRSRLRDRFNRGGEKALLDYELLEIVLFRSVPRRDVKVLAKTLLSKFGSFADVMYAREARLKEVEGIGDAIVSDFKLIVAAANRISFGEITPKQVLASWSAVIRYCRQTMAFEDREQFRILFLNKRNALIADEVQQIGTVDHTPVYIREVLKRSLELSAISIVLVHNHPSGDLIPSAADINMTKQIAEVGKPLGVSVYDHIIIGREGHASLRGLNLL